MASSPNSSSLQWDKRNQGFISPSQLQQMRLHSPNRDLSSSPAQEPLPAQPPSRPPQSAPPQTHNRSSSFFSIFGRSNEPPQPAPFSSLQARRTNSAQGPDEQGRMSLDKGRPTLSSPLSSPSVRGQAAPERRASIAGGAPPGPTGPQQPLHPEIRSVVQLTLAHAHKVYFSGPLVRRIERLPDGHQPAKDEGWRDVWAQLGGTTLSVWDMKEIEEASKVGKEVPPTYINITDAFVNVLGAVTIPASGDNPAKKYSNVVTVNTAGSNLLLFSCPSTVALISWATAFRLSAWEKSRLEEIYTAHLVRITYNSGRELPSTLVRSRMEGWVRVRMAGQTDWKRLWMTISSGSSQEALTSSDRPSSPGAAPRKRRISALFSSREDNHGGLLYQKSIVSFFLSQKTKDKKRPVMSFQDVTQAFAVYPERPELINRSTLMKLEGTFGDEEVAGAMRGKEGWVLVMPELESGLQQHTEMLKWLIALHDAFQLYGRPKEYSWDPRDPASMMFAYPIGPNRDLLFLEREMAESMDPRDDRTSAVRSRLLNILLERMSGVPPQQRQGQPGRPSVAPTLPPLPSLSESEPESGGSGSTPSQGALPQLPALNFDSSPANGNGSQSEPGKRILTPITEGSADSKTRSLSVGDNATVRSPLGQGPPEEADENGAMLDRPMNSSPSNMSPTALQPNRRPSEDTVASIKNVNPSRPSPQSQSRQSFAGSVAKNSMEERSSPNSINVTSRASIKTVNSSFSPPPLSPATSSNPPASINNVPPPRTPSPAGFSILTSPHSILSSPNSPIDVSERSPEFRSFANSAERAPRSPGTPPITARAPLPPSKLSSEPAMTKEEPDDDDDLYAEAGALYYMQQFDQQDAPRRVPPKPTSDDDETSSDESSEEARAPPPPPPQKTVSPLRTRANSPPAASVRSGARSPQQWQTRSPAPPAKSPTTDSAHSGSDRRPVGARAAPGSNRHDALSPELFSTDASDIHRIQNMSAHDDEENADALAALTFLEQDEPSQPAQPAARSVASPPPLPASQPPAIVAPEQRSGSPSSDAHSQYRSSFAPSRKAMERKAQTEAQQAAHEAASHRPGRAGKAKANVKNRRAWGDSSDEEEEEEEEEEDVDSDGEPTAPVRDDRSASGYFPPVGPGQPLQPSAVPSTESSQSNSAHARPPRNLPQVPPPRSQGGYESDSRRPYPDQYSQAERRTAYEDSLHPSSAGQSGIPTHAPAPVPPRHMWSQVLDPGHTPGSVPDGGRDTFIQLEPATQTMTKAFTPHGLLSAGLQDKEDRSAKKQEELARESGASLVNVPNKPPPPQTGLLGAITGYERERKREGGVGATLTEREREKRMAEERQRKLDEYQRQQLEQMAQGGSMYGAQQFPGYNPMMNPMMMGINPMMSGFMGGYPGMMPGMQGYGNPQHMFAAQQAAQAYQQAMMSLSQAGSQVGVDAGGQQQMNPMMTGASMGGYDPRFSMMMPMMSPMPMGGMNPMGQMSPMATGQMSPMATGQMSPMATGGMPGAMNGGMMNGGMPGMNGGMQGAMGGAMSPMPMNMQMTGNTSQFDPRLSQYDPGLQPPSASFANQGGRFPSRNSSAGNSPVRRPADDESVRRSADASPRPPQ